MIGLTTLTASGRPIVTPKLNRKRAALVLSAIDEILTWEKHSGQERDVRFVELGHYLCEVRAGQYWRLDNLKSFDQWVVAVFGWLEAAWKQIPPRGSRYHASKVTHRSDPAMERLRWS